jgi:hypothetical protein
MSTQYSDIPNNPVAIADVKSQQSNLLYYLGEDVATDTSAGYVFELGALDISDTVAVDPSFETLLTGVSSGLGGCDAVLEFDVSLSKFQGLFSIQIDSSDVDDVSATDVLFRMNSSGDQTYNDAVTDISVGDFFDNVAFSEAVAKHGKVNAAYPNQQVKFDFVRHLAKSITGGYSSSDIFTNEDQLVEAVVALDAPLNASINSVINAKAALGYQPVTNTDVMIQAAHQLYQLNLQSNDGGAPGTSRSDQLLSDIAAASTKVGPNPASLNVPLRFDVNDRVAIRINYKPNSSTFSSNGASIPDRAYKVLFRLV